MFHIVAQSVWVNCHRRASCYRIGFFLEKFYQHDKFFFNVSSSLSDILQFDDTDVSHDHQRQQDYTLPRRQESVKCLLLSFFNLKLISGKKEVSIKTAESRKISTCENVNKGVDLERYYLLNSLIMRP